MAYTRTWNAAYEASPAGSDIGSTLDNRARETKQDIRERIAKDHYMDIAGTDADHGEHKQVTLRTGAYSGTGSADKAVIHAVDVGGKARPCYYDEDSTLLRLVALPGGAVTKMPFFQAAAPLGWTQVTTNTDAFLRVVSTAGGGTGGSVSAATLAHTHTMDTHIHTMSTHNHKVTNYQGTTTATQVYDTDGVLNNITAADMGDTGPYGIAVTATAMVLAEDMYSSNVDPGNTNATDPGDTNSTSITPKYINVIVCSLD